MDIVPLLFHHLQDIKRHGKRKPDKNTDKAQAEDLHQDKENPGEHDKFQEEEGHVPEYMPRKMLAAGRRKRHCHHGTHRELKHEEIDCSYESASDYACGDPLM